MPSITLKQATKIIEGAFEKGKKIRTNPLAVIVLDDGGNVVAYQRQDKSSVLRFQIALGKAFGAIGMGQPSRNLENVAKERPHFATALSAASGGRFVPVAGGSIIKSKSGDIVGAVGVTGDTSDRDEQCGLAGIAAANLKAG
jgi:uncharacterized protein GlcG (DUF336 family)